MTLPAAMFAAALRLAGTVTFAREDTPFCFMRDGEGTNWRVALAEGAPAPSVGDVISVTGVREPSVKHRLATETLEISGRDPASVPPPEELEIAELFRRIMPFGNTALYGGTFTVEGMLRDINRRQATTQLLVGEDDRNIQVEMPWALEKALPADLVLGARVRVTGALAYTSIENFEEGIFGRIENVELIPMSSDAVRVVERAPAPPFWTPGRLVAAFAVAAVALAAMAMWVMTLRRMVRRKTRELADSIRQRETARIEADASRRERLRLAADLHDGFQQYLAGAMFRIRAARNYLPPDAGKSREQLEKARDALQHTQNGLRSTLWAMNEESEGPESIKALFGFVARRMAHWEGIVHIESEGEERAIARNFCGSLLLVLQEAVGNALTHGGAGNITVKISFGEKSISLSVADDGCGFDPAAVREAGHYGLSTMERRIGELGGTMSIESAPGKGATLTFEIPA